MTNLRLSDMLECMICLDEMKEPKMLPCQHSFCLECLREIYREKGGPKLGKIICPICKNEAILQGPKTNGKKIVPPQIEELELVLPNNFALVNLIDYKRQQEKAGLYGSNAKFRRPAPPPPPIPLKPTNIYPNLNRPKVPTAPQIGAGGFSDSNAEFEFELCSICRMETGTWLCLTCTEPETPLKLGKNCLAKHFDSFEHHEVYSIEEELAKMRQMKTGNATVTSYVTLRKQKKPQAPPPPPPIRSPLQDSISRRFSLQLETESRTPNESFSQIRTNFDSKTEETEEETRRKMTEELIRTTEEIRRRNTAEPRRTIEEPRRTIEEIRRNIEEELSRRNIQEPRRTIEEELSGRNIEEEPLYEHIPQSYDYSDGEDHYQYDEIEGSQNPPDLPPARPPRLFPNSEVERIFDLPAEPRRIAVSPSGHIFVCFSKPDTGIRKFSTNGAEILQFCKTQHIYDFRLYKDKIFVLCGQQDTGTKTILHFIRIHEWKHGAQANSNSKKHFINLGTEIQTNFDVSKNFLVVGNSDTQILQFFDKKFFSKQQKINLNADPVDIRIESPTSVFVLVRDPINFRNSIIKISYPNLAQEIFFNHQELISLIEPTMFLLINKQIFVADPKGNRFAIFGLKQKKEFRAKIVQKKIFGWQPNAISELNGHLLIGDLVSRRIYKWSRPISEVNETVLNSVSNIF